jgi:hypothetical protein
LSDARNALTERIAFAEDWLDRAKRQLADGNVAHGSLHVLLAEAELQRAREVTTSAASPDAMSSRAPSRPAISARVTAGVIAVVSVAAALWWQVPVARDTAEPADTSWPVVVFSGRTGDMLRLAGASNAPSEPMIVERTVERTILKPMIVRVPVAPRVQPAAVAIRPSEARVVPAPRAAQAPAPVVPAPQPAHTSTTQSTTAEAPPAAPVLSDADVIDLVLAAERSLRQPAKH